MGLNSEAIRETLLRGELKDNRDTSGVKDQRWWHDRFDWPRLPRIHVQVPVLYDRHISYMSALDIVEEVPRRSDSGSGKSNQNDQTPFTLLQRVLTMH